MVPVGSRLSISPLRIKQYLYSDDVSKQEIGIRNVIELAMEGMQHKILKIVNGIYLLSRRSQLLKNIGYQFNSNRTAIIKG